MTISYRRAWWSAGIAALVAVMIGVPNSGFAEKEPASPALLRVLFVGNSQVYYNDLPRLLEGLAESAPKDRRRIRADRTVAGGASLESHWNRGAGKGTLSAKHTWRLAIARADGSSRSSNS
jgi:hypothetical protein